MPPRPLALDGRRLGVALSGGGVRASLFVLGGLLYLVDSGLNRQVSELASVSGGSITSASIAQGCDFMGETPASFDPIAAHIAHRISRGLIPRNRLLAGAAVLLAAVIAIVGFGRPVDFPWWADVLLIAASGVLLSLRGVLLGRFLQRNLYRDRGPDTLSELAGLATTHVFCATDLSSSSPIYMMTRRPYLFSPFWGATANAKAYPRVTLVDAVRASAAFPAGLPPKRLHVGGLGLEPTTGMYRTRLNQLGFLALDRTKLKRLYLADGGVWNNLATDWFSPETQAQLPTRNVVDRRPVDRFVVLDASAPVVASTRRGLLAVPWLGEVVSLTRVLRSLSASTVAARLEGLRASASDARCLGVISISDDVEAERATGGIWHTRARKKGEWTTYLPGQLRPYTATLPTTLSRVSPDAALALLVHGYSATRATMIGLDPALEEPAPPLDRFARLLGLSVTELPDGRRIVTLPSKPLTAFERFTLPAFGALQAGLQDVDSDMALHERHRRALVRTAQDALDISEDMDALAGVIAAREAFGSGMHDEAAQRYAEVLEARSMDWQGIQPDDIANYATALAALGHHRQSRSLLVIAETRLATAELDNDAPSHARLMREYQWRALAEAYTAAGRTEDAARALRRAAPGDRT